MELIGLIGGWYQLLLSWIPILEWFPMKLKIPGIKLRKSCVECEKQGQASIHLTSSYSLVSWEPALLKYLSLSSAMERGRRFWRRLQESRSWDIPLEAYKGTCFMSSTSVDALTFWIKLKGCVKWAVFPPGLPSPISTTQKQTYNLLYVSVADAFY